MLLVTACVSKLQVVHLLVSHSIQLIMQMQLAAGHIIAVQLRLHPNSQQAAPPAVSQQRHSCSNPAAAQLQNSSNKCR